MTTGKITKTNNGTGGHNDNPPVAAGLLVGGLFLLGLQDGLIKLTSSHVSLWQMQLIRASGNLFLLLIIAGTVWGALPPAPKRLWAVALRSLFLTSAMVLFFGGVPFLELSEIAAGLYVFPLFVAVLSAVILGETVGPRRIGAVIVGFTGTLLILKPGTDAFQWISLMPVAAGLCYAATVLSTRRLCREEHPVTMAFGVALAFISVAIVGLVVMSIIDVGTAASKWPYLLTAWHPLEFWVAAIILTCSTLNLTANISLTRALPDGRGELAGAVRLFVPDLRDVLGLRDVAARARRPLDPRHGADRRCRHFRRLAGAPAGETGGA